MEMLEYAVSTTLFNSSIWYKQLSGQKNHRRMDLSHN